MARHLMLAEPFLAHMRPGLNLSSTDATAYWQIHAINLDGRHLCLLLLVYIGRLQRRGGCKVWLEGVKSWVTRSDIAARWIESARVYAVATDETDTAHVLFSLSLDDQSFFVDSKGIWTSPELEVRLAQEYQYDDYWLKPWEQVDPRWGMIPYDPEIVSMIEEALFRIIGPFTLSHFLALPDLVIA